jgi:hypothetical protein
LAGPEIKRRRITMTHLDNNRTARTSDKPLTGIDLDAFLIDDEFDDSLDRQFFVIRESLADYRNL